MRESHLHPNFDVPDAPQEGDTVRVYADTDPNTEYYVIGEVIKYNDETDSYTVRFYNRAGEPRTLKAHARAVEVESIKRN